MSEFVRAVIAAGMDSEDVMAILRSPDEAKTWVAQWKASRTPPLFVSPEQQLQNARLWWKSFFYDSQYQYVEDQMADLASSTEPLVAWVLVPHFNSVEQTFDWLWEQAARIHPVNYRSVNAKSGPEHLRMLDGIEFTSNCLTWELIDFGAYLNGRPDKVRGSDSAEFALLAAASHHPTWAMSHGKTVSGIYVPYVNLCGLQIRFSGSEGWKRVPYLFGVDERLKLDADHDGFFSSNWACPVRLESSN